MSVLTEVEILNNATQELNAAIATVEAAIRSKKYGVVAYVKVADDYDIGWSKIDNQWRLVSAHNDTEEPLINATRESRIRAVYKFNALIVELMAATNVELSRVKAATKAADDVAKQLTGSGAT